jgi:hypothetical protein
MIGSKINNPLEVLWAIRPFLEAVGVIFNRLWLTNRRRDWFQHRQN